ncbi:MAG TPA: polyketide cyclase, partial [Gammaproteobacteria bacterium]
MQHPPVVEVQMLIRRPVAEVFEAFVNPDITTRFWFTKSSGRLEPGAQVRWDWEMYGVFATVSVKA